MIFRDRIEAGRILAQYLRQYANRPDVVVLALPRGGVPVAYPVAEALNAPLDIIIVQKLGAPGQEELAIGAIASGGVRVINQRVVQHLGTSQEEVDAITSRERQELERRERLYRDNRQPVDVKHRIVVLVDDGLATGSSIRAAVAALRQKGPKQIVAAVPVASESTCEELRNEVDHVVCAMTPVPFFAVGQWYHDFSPTQDEEVRELLGRAAARQSSRAA